VAKHAQALQVVVTLSSTGDALHLTVRDDGSGFDINRDIGNTGIGLSSADERLRLLRGTLVVESKPGLGTIVRATVPIGATP
jgi:signal transduction histidine kinase